MTPTAAQRREATPDPYVDPRRFEYISTNALIVDPRKQRECDVEAVARIAHEWDWARFEVATVAVSTIKDCYDVVEGQHRVMAAHQIANKRNRDIMIPCMILPAKTSDTAQSQLALDITKGRKQHTAWEKWRLKVQAGPELHPHECTADAMMKELNPPVRLGQRQSANTIAAVATVSRIVHGGGFTPEYGAEMLKRTIEALVTAFPTWDHASNVTRWDRNLLLAVANIIIHNDNLDQPRFVQAIAVRPAGQWVNLGKGAEQLSPDVAIRLQIAKQYNHGLRRGRIDEGVEGS